jgi:hypothetical protein
VRFAGDGPAKTQVLRITGACQSATNMVVTTTRSALRQARQPARSDDPTMPTLFRFLTIIAVIGGLIYGGLFALSTLFDPKPREITVTVPPDKFLKR